MKAVRRSLLLCMALLAGCSFKTEWRDTSGQGRGAEQAKADLALCAPPGTYPERGDPNLAEKVKAASDAVTACMTAKGWKLVRAS